MTEKETLQFLIESGKISKDDISNIKMKEQKEKVLKIHKQKIWKGADGRWQTHIYVDGKRKLVAKKEEKALYDALHDHYYGEEKSYKTCTLPDIYDEWLNYKTKTCKSENTAYRLDADYKRFYLHEELSEKIMTTPLLDINVSDIKEWGFTLIKKYDLTHKAWLNARSVLKQVYDYLIDKGLAEKNPVQLVRIPKGTCKKNPKKKASTQVFFHDETLKLIPASMRLASEKKDVAFLAIPLLFYTGMRIGECLALTFDDFDADKHLVSINKMVVAKNERLLNGSWSKRYYTVEDHVKGNGDARDVCITDDCFRIVEIIKKMHKEDNEKSSLLFPGVTPSNVQFKLYRLCDKLGQPRRSPHKCRKTYVSTLLNEAFDADFVREQVGHKELQTTLNSYAFSTTRADEQVEKLERVFAH